MTGFENQIETETGVGIQHRILLGHGMDQDSPKTQPIVNCHVKPVLNVSVHIAANGKQLGKMFAYPVTRSEFV